MRGASVDTVSSALAEGNPFPGTYGFAGELPDGTAVRDVLGRQPLFYDAAAGMTAYNPHELAAPESFPAGYAWTRNEEPSQVFSLPDPDPVSDEQVALQRVRSGVDAGFDGIESAGLAVAFSGGVDSALVAANVDAPLYVVGYESSSDIDAARESAELMGRASDLVVHEVTVADIEAAIPTVANAICLTNAMDVQIALPLYLVAERVAEDGFTKLALGQGADELFGGYAKVANALDDHRVDAETIRGARRETLEALPEQVERDVLAVRAAGIEPVTPLLHDAVVEAALLLPESLLVANSVRKVALRRIATEQLPDVVANREKKAVQYGSLVAREVDRLARQAGFKRRMDDHIQQYIESRMDE